MIPPGTLRPRGEKKCAVDQTKHCGDDHWNGPDGNEPADTSDDELTEETGRQSRNGRYQPPPNVDALHSPHDQEEQ